MTNIVLSGGSGTRLWPISRTLMPKQFVKLFSDKSLFQNTIERNASICKNHLIVSNTEQYFLAFDQIQEINKTNCKYLLEPLARNTAPAIALACFDLDAEEIVLVTPSDHLIKDDKSYQEAIFKAKILAEKDNIVAFGIKPTFPEIGFGYIQTLGPNSEDVKSFHEKPNLQTVKKYLEDSNYYWNSGIFMFKAGVFLEELKKYNADIYDNALYAFQNSINDSIIRIKHEHMANIPEGSIDYEVIEKSNNVKVICLDIGWSDIGSFDSLYKELDKDENKNTLNSNHIQIDSKNNLVYGNNRKIATIDVEDLIIIDTADALLISKNGSSQKVKNVLEKIKTSNESLVNVHVTAYKPWGTYTVLEDAPGYKIKRIEVKPGCRMSLQKHFHRTEHWIVLSGTATVTVGNETRLIKPNESTYIKMGEIHRLSNEGKIPLVLIEVQVGEYTGEDDIVRVHDDFKRA